MVNNRNVNLIYSKVITPKFSLKMSPNSKLLREYKMKFSNLSEIQWETCIGLMLEDASLQTQNKGKTYRLKFEWGDKNKLYAEHIHLLMNEWILSPLHKKSRVNINGNTVITWGFQTLSHSAFNPLSKLFYLINKKE